jgi:hypothetical protein
MERHVQYLSGLPRTSAEPALAAYAIVGIRGYLPKLDRADQQVVIHVLGKYFPDYHVPAAAAAPQCLRLTNRPTLVPAAPAQKPVVKLQLFECDPGGGRVEVQALRALATRIGASQDSLVKDFSFQGMEEGRSDGLARFASGLWLEVKDKPKPVKVKISTAGKLQTWCNSEEEAKRIFGKTVAMLRKVGFGQVGVTVEKAHASIRVLSQTAIGALGFAVDLQKWRKDDDTLKVNDKNNSITCEQYTCPTAVWGNGKVRISTKAGQDDGHIVICYEELLTALETYKVLA